MAKNKGGLGRGLDALIPDLPDLLNEPQTDGDIIEAPVNDITPNPSQPRLHFDEAELQELAASIKESGVLSPLLVVERNGVYQLVSGERRLRAAKIADLETVPVIVRELSDEDVAQLALVENIQRADLTAYEEARGYERLMNEFGHSAAELADAVGKSRPHVANTVRLLQLPESVLALLADGSLSAGHARTLLRLDDPALQLSLAQDAIRNGQSVRALEALVADILAPFPGDETDEKVAVRSHSRQSNKRWHPIQQQLSEKLQTNVRIGGNDKKAKLSIEFYGEDDLTRILDILGIELK